MKKSLATLVLLVLSVVAFAQLQSTPQWIGVLSDQPETFSIQLISSTENSIQVNVQVPGFYTTNVTTPRGEAKIISTPKSVSTAQAGEPNVPMTGIPVMIGDQARMNIRVLDAQYMDFEDIEVAPSKGDFSRQIDPATVPYTYGECYNQDAFFPANNVGLYDPYIIRDFRGQNMVVYPFAYNPISKTLRVYYNMTVEMYKVDDNGENTMPARKSNTIKMDPDFKSVYQHHFINYEASLAKYTPVDEEGDLLIICYSSFINSMTDFVNWKKTRGVNTTIVNASTAGSTYSDIKSYIQSQYNANNNLTHVLLVGDVAQIPGYTFSSSSGYKGDNPYGQIVGNDTYNDVFIGRFSAQNTTQVNTQVQKVITYERDLTTSDTWLNKGLGVSTTEGSGGHYNEDDYQHIENLRTDLINYGYSTVYQEYYSVSGYSSTTQQISTRINSGVGIINYCNHGSQTAWQSHSPYYSNSYVSALTNSNKLPFIFSVACLNGQYDYSSDCFAETWMRATNNNQPTGAIGGMFSYISQPWIPPMWAQDEFVDILVESYSNNKKHTFGGAAINSIMAIFDHYSSTSGDGYNTYQAWILYGDPSMMLRTKTPQAMTVTHNGNINLGASSYTVNVSNGNGALATITDASHNILGKATVSNGTATISLNSSNLTTGTELTLCVFGYNKVTYLGTIEVVGGSFDIAVSANPSEGGTVSGTGTYSYGESCTVTATANEGYTFVNWMENNEVVSTEATYSFAVTNDRALVANFNLNSYLVIAAPNPVEGGTVAIVGIDNGGPNEVVYDFEDGTSQGWTVLQGPDSDSPNNWMHCTAYTMFDFATGHGHNSNGFMLSESYIYDSPNSGIGVNPDNYLVSPRIPLGGSITFWATNVDDGFGEEHFAVAVSTDSNTDASDFTVVEEWTLLAEKTGVTRNINDGVWHEYTADLSSFSGMGYVAIRHFNCFEQWILCVDDITIVEGYTGICSATYSHGESCTLTATANEGYTFVNWTEDGEEVSTDASYSFEVTGDRALVANFEEDNAMVTQSTTFGAGWNWWTPNVGLDGAELLSQLKSALGNNGVKIMAQDGRSVTNSSHGWGAGSLTSLEVGSMYMVQTTSSCNFTVEGPAVNPASQNVTVKPGNNWIGFFGTEAVPVNTALSNLTATTGDAITAQDGSSATYTSHGWGGTLKNLVPGEAYIYNSKASSDKTFIFFSAK